MEEHVCFHSGILVLHSKFGSTPESVTSCTVILQYIFVEFTCVYCTETLPSSFRMGFKGRVFVAKISDNLSPLKRISFCA